MAQPIAWAVGRAGLASGPRTLKAVWTPSSRRAAPACRSDWWYSGVLLQRQITPALYLGGELFHETAQTVDGRPSTGFNVGGGYAIEGPWQVLFSAGRNITDVADNRFSYYLALYRTF